MNCLIQDNKEIIGLNTFIVWIKQVLYYRNTSFFYELSE